MSDLVDPSEIERLVGVTRHATEHYGRAVPAEEQVYVLHSQQCKDTREDLRDCPYSIALDRGITSPLPWTGWRRTQDRPVHLTLYRGWLLPDFAEYKAGFDEEKRDAVWTPRPDCWCFLCDEHGATSTPLLAGMRQRMNLCPDCGNKRCPRATNHDNECTRSNAHGQDGSLY